ncbi:hypothetical protein LTR78_001343 [Recurvomyces mirabilis]|uniref:Malate dehydrogenase n=1 Tax=Recurvomyces mirabilis TaxID=574656 RepID=A0AAE0WVM0_9PEZI|nr:hypothetical protein LTR78_001343 [Recurvomyces mirabilis]KAK5161320.1 hypothetical protein LTS14_001116 [Recurvomyces mirabilis]
MVAIISSLLATSSLLAIGNCLPRRSNSVAPSLPLKEVTNTGSAPLPSPTTGLKYIAVQIGTQNYTCNAETGKYTATGALARIYDATSYLANHPDQVDSLSRTYLNLYTSQPCSQHPSTTVAIDDVCEDLANLQHFPPLPILGQHYFTSTGTPTFDLYLGWDHPFLYAKKVGDVPAPSANDVDWLYLTSNGSPQNNIINSVYRIETVGGVAPKTCSGSGSIEVPYAAEYWYYV